jgi:transcriptional regulator with XRE-family HTH domain
MKLADYLAQANLTQAQFAELVSGTQPEIARYAAGKRKPREKMMREIFKATGGKVTANDFYGLPSHGCCKRSAERVPA